MCDRCLEAEKLYGAGSSLARAIRLNLHPIPPSRDVVGPKAFREVKWSDFCMWVQGRTVKHQRQTVQDSATVTLELRFHDGSVAEVSSNYDGPLSDETPGNGVEPPTVRVRDP